MSIFFIVSIAGLMSFFDPCTTCHTISSTTLGFFVITLLAHAPITGASPHKVHHIASSLADDILDSLIAVNFAASFAPIVAHFAIAHGNHFGILLIAFDTCGILATFSQNVAVLLNHIGVAVLIISQASFVHLNKPLSLFCHILWFSFRDCFQLSTNLSVFSLFAHSHLATAHTHSPISHPANLGSPVAVSSVAHTISFAHCIILPQAVFSGSFSP